MPEDYHVPNSCIIFGHIHIISSSTERSYLSKLPYKISNVGTTHKRQLILLIPKNVRACVICYETQCHIGCFNKTQSPKFTTVHFLSPCSSDLFLHDCISTVDFLLLYFTSYWPTSEKDWYMSGLKSSSKRSRKIQVRHRIPVQF